MRIQTVDFNDSNASENFTTSIRETGFAVIKNHPINQDLIWEVMDDWKGYFAQETDVKMQDRPDPDKQDGYYPYKIEKAKGNPFANLKEYYHYYKQCDLPGVVSDKSLNLFTQMNTVAQRLAGWLQDHTPEDVRDKFEITIPEMIDNSPASLMRIIHYPPLDGSEDPGEIRAGEHEDVCFLTLICGASERGLQVKDNDGTWYDVDNTAEQIIVNAGDQLQELTKGFYRSTTHRVIKPEEQDQTKPRYSMPFFMHAKPDVRLSDEFTAREFVQKRLIENNVFDKSQTLKTS